MDVPVYAWAVVLGIIATALALDLFVLHKDAHEVSVKEATLTSVGWITLGLTFGLAVWLVWGGTFAGEYYAGYLIEKSLSVDNVFVFALLLAYFGVAPKDQHRVLFWGVVGALLLRGAFIAAGAAFLETFHWAIYVFGALLVVSGLKMAFHHGAEVHPDKNPVVRLVRRVSHNPILPVLVAVETTDVVFAVDSIPAIFAVTEEPFLVFTSNAFAILGLRALYFLLAGVMDRFTYLKVGLSIVLVFVGVKMLVADVYHLPVWASLLAIATILTVAVVASLRRPAHLPGGDVELGGRAGDGDAAPAPR